MPVAPYAMATSTTSELATLTRLLNTPGLAALPVRVTLQGELQLEVNGPGPLERIQVLLEGGIVTDLYAAVTDKGGQVHWLKNCLDLFDAVSNGWLTIATAPSGPSSEVIISTQQSFIPSPPEAQVGDILVFDGSRWTSLATGPSTYVLTSNGTGFLPSYQPPTGGGGTPGGLNGSIQFNDSSSFNGSTTLSWNKLTDTLTLNGTLQHSGPDAYIEASDTLTLGGGNRVLITSDKIIVANNDIVLEGPVAATTGGAGTTVTGSTLSDPSKAWVVNELIGNFVRVETDAGEVVEGVVTSNTVDSLTVDQTWPVLTGTVTGYEVTAASLRVRNLADPVLPHDAATKQWVEAQVVTASGGPKILGQVTTGLSKGDVCFLSGANTWSKARADSTLAAATTGGVFNGTAGIIELTGSVIDEVNCTTDGGIPAIGARVYLASSTADGGSGTGKVTSIPPEPSSGGSVNLQIVGICVDNTNYASFKTVKVIFQPSYPTILVG